MKGKKILKALGVGVLCSLGAITFAGCSSSDLSQEQMDKIMYTIDQSDIFMDQTINLLERSNAKLSLDEAWNLHKYAVARIKANDHELFDNMTIVMSGNGYIYETRCYKTTLGENVFVGLQKDEGEEDYSIKEVKYSFKDQDNDDCYVYYSTEGVYGHIEKNYGQLIFLDGDLPLLYSSGFEKEDLASVEVLENGNYLLKFGKIQEESYEYNDYTYETAFGVVAMEEVSRDGKIIKEEREYSYYEYRYETATHGDVYTTSDKTYDKLQYSYGTLTAGDINPYLNTAKEAYANYHPGV